MIKITNLNDIMEKHCHKYTSNVMFEIIDNKISFVLEKARQFAKGPKWSIPFSIIKAEARASLLY